MKSKSLILVGGGGHCKSVIDVAESNGYTIKGVLDLPENLGKKVLNYYIIGNDDNISEFIDDYQFMITIGQIKNVKPRIELFNRITNLGGKFATIISRSSVVSDYSTIETGTCVMHQSVINANAKIGKCCIINTLANIEHDSIIEDFCHISTGVTINGSCRIGKSSFIGSNTVLFNGIYITEGCIISAGSVVRSDLNKKGLYYGNPVKLIKEL